MEIKEGKTKMVAGEEKVENKAEKKVKIRLMRDALIDRKVHLAGAEVEVSEQLADELCEKKQGPYNFAGYRPESQATRSDMRKAVRI